MTTPPPHCYKTIIESHYFPSVPYLSLLLEDIRLEKHENYQKQTHRNRTQILTPNGVDTLVIPVMHSGQKIPITEVRTDESKNWRNRHWRAMASAYGKSPFFEYFEDSLKEVIYSPTDSLWQLNRLTLDYLRDCFRLKGRILETESYQKSVPQDLRNYFESQPDLSYRYRQGLYPLFSKGLSGLDLLCWVGPREGLEVLEQVYEQVIKVFEKQ